MTPSSASQEKGADLMSKEHSLRLYIVKEHARFVRTVSLLSARLVRAHALALYVSPACSHEHMALRVVWSGTGCEHVLYHVVVWAYRHWKWPPLYRRTYLASLP